MQHAVFGQPRLARGSKSFKRGGRAKATQVSQPATRGTASRGRWRPREGKSFPRRREEEEIYSDWGGSEAEDPRSFGIQDSLDPGLESVDGSMESRGKISLEGMFPHGQELIPLVPAGDLNPNRSLGVFQMDTPPPLVSPEIIPAREPLSNPLFP